MPVTTKTTSQNFSGTGSQTAFQFTIEYDSTKISDLKVEVDNVLQTETTHYSISGTTLTFVSAPAAGTNNIRIYRSTSLDSAGAVFAAGSSIRATDLNNNQDQFLFAAQELQNDQLQDTVGATPPSGPFNGQRWYNTTNGRTYVWYVDVDTSQWVEASPPFDADGDRSFTQTGAGAVARTWDSKLKERLSLKDFGAVGDYDTDDTTAVTNWLAAAASQNKIAYAPSGVYRINNTGIDLPEHIHIKGEVSPSIYTFPQQKGDKIKLKPGIKNTISGTVFIFDGTGDKTETTTRKEVTGGAPTYHSFKYCMKYNYDAGLNMSDIGIILDLSLIHI